MSWPQDKRILNPLPLRQSMSDLFVTAPPPTLCASLDRHAGDSRGGGTVKRIRFSIGLMLTLPLGACTPLVPPAQLALPVGHAHPDDDQAIDRTRRAFTQAAQSAHVQGMANFFTSDGMVITADGDTVRGREALAQFFATDRATITAAVFHFGEFSREFHLQKCTDGANERGRFHAKRQGASDTVSGPYAIRWQWDSVGDAKIQRLTFVKQAAIRQLGPSGCYIPLAVQQQSKRIAVSLFGVANSGDPSGAVASAMRQQGWEGGNLNKVCPSWTICTYHNTPWSHLSTHGPLGLALGVVSFQFTPSLATEVMIGARPKGSTVGLDSAGTTQLEAMWSGYFVGAALLYERAGFQVGLGPAVDHTSWRLVRESPYNSNLRSESDGRVTPLGVILDAGYHRALLGPFRLDLRAQLREFGKATLPGGATYLNAPVDDNGSFIGLGVGMVL
jgi:ketosteroid isomerase-like protein